VFVDVVGKINEAMLRLNLLSWFLDCRRDFLSGTGGEEMTRRQLGTIAIAATRLVDRKQSENRLSLGKPH
jgi:hypothetical protein